MAGAFIRLSGLLSPKNKATESPEEFFTLCKKDLLKRAAEKPVLAEGLSSLVEVFFKNPGWVENSKENSRLMGRILTTQIRGFETNFFATPKSTGYLLADSLRLMGAGNKRAGEAFVDLLDGKLDFDDKMPVLLGYRAFSKARVSHADNKDKYVRLVLDGFWAFRKGASDAKLGEDLCERKLEPLVKALHLVYPKETVAALKEVKKDEAFYGSLSSREARTLESYLTLPWESGAGPRPSYGVSFSSMRQKGPGFAP